MKNTSEIKFKILKKLITCVRNQSIDDNVTLPCCLSSDKALVIDSISPTVLYIASLSSGFELLSAIRLASSKI